MSACVKFGLDRHSRLAGHTEQTSRQTDRQTNKHIAFYYIDIISVAHRYNANVLLSIIIIIIIIIIFCLSCLTSLTSSLHTVLRVKC